MGAYLGKVGGEFGFVEGDGCEEGGVVEGGQRAVHLYETPPRLR